MSALVPSDGPVRARFVPDQREYRRIHCSHEQHKDQRGAFCARHAAAVVNAVQRNCGQITQHKVQLAATLVTAIAAQLGAAVENTHEHREAHVAGNGQNCARQGDGQAVVEDILHVFKRGETQRYEHRVYDGVVAVVEVGVVPSASIEKEEFLHWVCALRFHNRK